MIWTYLESNQIAHISVLATSQNKFLLCVAIYSLRGLWLTNLYGRPPPPDLAAIQSSQPTVLLATDKSLRLAMIRTVRPDNECSKSIGH